MIYVRLLLAGVLLALSVLVGKARAKKLELRTAALSDLIGFSRRLEVQIRVNNKTIPEALDGCTARCGEQWTGTFARELASAYQTRKPAAGMWAAALKAVAENHEEASALLDADREALALFGDQLAASDLKSIGDNFSLFYARLEENLQASTADAAVKGRLYNTIGILAGLAAAIVVI